MADIPGNNTTTARLEESFDPTDLSAYGVASSTIDFAGDTDRWRVALLVGHTYTFFGHLTNSDVLPDIQIQLFDAAGQPIPFALDDDFGPGFDAFFSFTPTTSADYFLEARAFPFAPTLTGAYQITLLENAGAVSQGSELAETGTFNAPNAELTFLAGNGDDTITLGTGYRFLLGDAGADTLNGNSLDNKIFGGVGGDNLNGNGGNDFLSGGDGVDILSGRAGDDTLWGGAGDDYLTGGIGDNHMFGGDGIDTIFGASFGEGGPVTAGNNTIDGGGGNDKIDCGFSGGDDVVDGGSGDDNIRGRGGNDHLLGGDGNDFIAGDQGDDTVEGGAGDDTLVGDEYSPSSSSSSLGGNDTLIGGDGSDYFEPGHGQDIVVGGLGWDKLSYSGRSDPATAHGIVASWLSHTVIDVSGSTDTFSAIEAIMGSEYDDIFIGDAASNSVEGLGGNDTFDGGGGIDQIEFHGLGVILDLDNGTGTGGHIKGGATDGQGDTDTLIDVENVRGSSSDDQLTGSSLANALWGLDGADRLFGEAGNDQLFGDAGDDRLDGGAGNDTLVGGLGTDTLIGGLGNDTYVLENGADFISDVSGTADIITSAISRSLAGYGTIEQLVLVNVATALTGTGNNLSNIIAGNNFANTLSGGIGNDTLVGGVGNDTLTGGVGNDKLIGGVGNDRMFGGAGIDTLTGGLNNDTFVFNAPLSAANRDTITDFNHVADTFHLENAVMTKLGAGVHGLSSTMFRAGAAALDANDYVVYNRASGALYYDSNGNAAGGATLLATLTNKPALAANDFMVI